MKNLEEHLTKRNPKEEMIIDKLNLKKTNKMAKLKTIKIKGKDYVMVNERVKYFRENYPDHSIVTYPIEKNETRVVPYNGTDRKKEANIIFCCEIRNSEDKIISTGTAKEYENANFINKTSYVENCETSAVGRALAFLGIGNDESIASADEVANAINNQ